MRKIILLAALVVSFCAKAQIFIGEEGTVSFFSKTAMEDIDAVNKLVKPILNGKNGEIAFKVTNIAFKFKSALMEEHFNENYMESEKYPHTIFKGKINETIDYTKEGENNVTVTGKMNMHGVEKDVTYKGKLIIKGGKVMLECTFKVKLADYNIKVPSVVGANIAEDIEIKVNSTLIPYKK